MRASSDDGTELAENHGRATRIEDVLLALAAELGLGRAVQILSEERDKVQSLIGPG
jgi:hypothetical protein